MERSTLPLVLAVLLEPARRALVLPTGPALLIKDEIVFLRHKAPHYSQTSYAHSLHPVGVLARTRPLPELPLLTRQTVKAGSPRGQVL